MCPFGHTGSKIYFAVWPEKDWKKYFLLSYKKINEFN